MRATITLKAKPDVSSENPAVYLADTNQAAQDSATAAGTDTPPPKAKVNPHAVQGAFLGANLNKIVTVFLISGIRLVGKLRAFDQYCLLLEAPDGTRQLVFKHAASTVAPGMARPKSTHDRSYE